MSPSKGIYLEVDKDNAVETRGDEHAHNSMMSRGNDSILEESVSKDGLKVKSNKWQVVPSHFGHDAYEHLDLEMKFVVMKNPVLQEHKNIVYNHIKNKILDQTYFTRH